MSLFNKIFGKEKISIDQEPYTIYAPADGAMIPLEEIPDPTFAEGLMGKGVGIAPSKGTLYAPFDGTIIYVASTKHAVCIKSTDGIEMMLHVGVDTVGLNGRGFELCVHLNDKVKAGQVLTKFDLDVIRAAHLSEVIAVLVLNSDSYKTMAIENYGQVKVGEKIMKVNGGE